MSSLTPKYRSRYAVIFLLIACARSISAAGTIPYEAGSRQRVENGYILLWKGHFTQQSDQVQVYDIQGTPVAHFPVLGIVPDATSVSLWDVAVSANRIAIAAVFAKPGSVQSTLLMFDLRGKLQSAFVLAPSRGIEMLDFDEQSHLWTVTISSGDKDPAIVPMIVEYDSSGRELQTFLTRNAFPVHAPLVKMTAKSGHPNGGFDGGLFWFWLPVSNDLVTVETTTGDLHAYSTGLPALEAGAFPFTLFKLSGDAFLLDTRNPAAQSTARFYSWSPAAGWATAAPQRNCAADGVLLGTRDGEPIMVDPASHELCAENISAFR